MSGFGLLVCYIIVFGGAILYVQGLFAEYSPNPITGIPELITGAVVIICGIGLFGYLHFSPEAIKWQELTEATEMLTQEAYDTKVVHGGITAELYNKMQGHNERITEIDPNSFWMQIEGLSPDDLLIDTSNYKVIDDNTFVQSVRIESENTKDTGEPADGAQMGIVNPDGWYYDFSWYYN